MAGSVLEELERLDADRPAPPPVLYKYVVPARIDVLKNSSIRFTPPLNTNDIFEVRQTFDLIMGPKMLAALKEISTEVDFDEQFSEALKGSPFSAVPLDEMKGLVSSALGADFESLAHGMLANFVDQMPDRMNTPENVILRE